MERENLYVISVIGLDKIGIVSKVTQFVFRQGVNIIDIEQSVIHSQFTMVLLIQSPPVGFQLSRVRIGLDRLADRLDMNITLPPFGNLKG